MSDDLHDPETDPAAPDVSRLLTLLTLEPIDRDIYRSPHPGEGMGRLFGGQVASQALRAAQSTVEAEHHVNSLHAYFLRPGRFGLPVTFVVDRIRDGSSFTTRRVVAQQDGEAILNLDASFHVAEDGEEYESPSPIDLVPTPDGSSATRSTSRPIGGSSTTARSNRRLRLRPAPCGSAPSVSSPTTPTCTRASSPTCRTPALCRRRGGRSAAVDVGVAGVVT